MGREQAKELCFPGSTTGAQRKPSLSALPLPTDGERANLAWMLTNEQEDAKGPGPLHSLSRAFLVRGPKATTLYLQPHAQAK